MRPVSERGGRDMGQVDVRMVLTVEEVRREMGISRWMIYELIRRGELPVVHIGRWSGTRAALEDWIASNTSPAAHRADVA